MSLALVSLKTTLLSPKKHGKTGKTLKLLVFSGIQYYNK